MLFLFFVGGYEKVKWSNLVIKGDIVLFDHDTLTCRLDAGAMSVRLSYSFDYGPSPYQLILTEEHCLSNFGSLDILETSFDDFFY